VRHNSPTTFGFLYYDSNKGWLLLQSGIAHRSSHHNEATAQLTLHDFIVQGRVPKSLAHGAS
jgi:hypothetical protein